MIEWYEKNGKSLPAWLIDEPISYPGDEFYIKAFWDLSSCRCFGSMIGPIPWDRIVMYGCRKRLNSGMLQVFEDVIRELDEVYLKMQRDTQKKRTQK